MQGKSSQQQAIVAKRDAENKRRQLEEAKRRAGEKTSSDVNKNVLMLAINKDACPIKDNIIMEQQCTGCKYYTEFTMYNGQPCIKCSYQFDNSQEL
jgi:hypothetical protein